MNERVSSLNVHRIQSESEVAVDVHPQPRQSLRYAVQHVVQPEPPSVSQRHARKGAMLLVYRTSLVSLLTVAASEDGVPDDRDLPLRKHKHRCGTFAEVTVVQEQHALAEDNRLFCQEKAGGRKARDDLIVAKSCHLEQRERERNSSGRTRSFSHLPCPCPSTSNHGTLLQYVRTILI